MIKWCAGFTVVLICTSTAFANFAPSTSSVPILRGEESTTTYIAPNRLLRSPIPRLRDGNSVKTEKRSNAEITALVQIAEHERQKENFKRAKAQSETQKVVAGLVPIRRSSIPQLRPKSLEKVRIAQPRAAIKEPTRREKKRKEKRIKSRRGSVCGVASIKGAQATRIRGNGGCGIANPVKVTEVSGVSLTRELIVNCKTAKTFNNWVKKSAKPVIGRKGGGLAAIQIIGGYSCRTRNSKRGAKLSEHAVGNAVDIAGFKLRDGTIYSVKRNWNGRGGRTLKKLHRSACGPFGTVLGPNADRHHRDHFHLDIARHRNGAYCR